MGSHDSHNHRKSPSLQTARACLPSSLLAALLLPGSSGGGCCDAEVLTSTPAKHPLPPVVPTALSHRCASQTTLDAKPLPNHFAALRWLSSAAAGRGACAPHPVLPPTAPETPEESRKSAEAANQPEIGRLQADLLLQARQRVQEHEGENDVRRNARAVRAEAGVEAQGALGLERLRRGCKLVMG